jgi:hypothetical protein
MHYKTDVFQCNIYAYVSRGDEKLRIGIKGMYL